MILKKTISVFNIISRTKINKQKQPSQYRQSWRTETKTTMKMLSHVNYHRCFFLFPWRRPRRRHTIPVVANVLWPLLLLLVVVSASGGAGGDDGVLEVFCEHRRNSHRVRVLFRHGYGTKARREMERRRRMWLSVVVSVWWWNYKYATWLYLPTYWYGLEISSLILLCSRCTYREPIISTQTP